MFMIGSLRLALAVLVLSPPSSRGLGAPPVEIKSPSGEIRLEFSAGGHHLTYSVSLAARTVVEPSALGLIIDAVDLGHAPAPGAVVTDRSHEPHPTRGGRCFAVSDYNRVPVPSPHTYSRTPLSVE